ncbi:MAG: hypothetical protein M5U34_35420 [Chloroflexi bacterium]|nr:hypothetical protein [Chloroflexota bacterium]
MMGEKRPFCPQFIKFSQEMEWKRPFCPQLMKFTQGGGLETAILPQFAKLARRWGGNGKTATQRTRSKHGEPLRKRKTP